MPRPTRRYDEGALTSSMAFLMEDDEDDDTNKQLPKQPSPPINSSSQNSTPQSPQPRNSQSQSSQPDISSPPPAQLHSLPRLSPPPAQLQSDFSSPRPAQPQTEHTKRGRIIDKRSFDANLQYLQNDDDEDDEDEEGDEDDEDGQSKKKSSKKNSKLRPPPAKRSRKQLQPKKHVVKPANNKNLESAYRLNIRGETLFF
uniref:Uncharacterized protein n=1 Tax=Panagrolaimus superbus TaxID=310955 RepID=A0A914YBK8_9BILA